ncbi:MAG: hypothetical protein AAFR35_04740 [Pseudomonadota bacterium]
MRGLAALVVCLVPLGASASPDPERRALFVDLVEALGCEMNNAQAAEILPTHGFDRSEMIEIVYQLEDEGLAERDGASGVLRLKTSGCPGAL